MEILAINTFTIETRGIKTSHIDIKTQIDNSSSSVSVIEGFELFLDILKEHGYIDYSIKNTKNVIQEYHIFVDDINDKRRENSK